MKLKYYLNNKVIAIIFLSIVVAILLINSASASLLTSSASPSKIFKCGESTIAATFSDGGLVSAYAVLNPTGAVQPMIPGRAGQNALEMAAPVNVTLTNNGSYWVGTFGDSPNMLWGTRSITYNVYNGGLHTYSSPTTVFVYNGGSTCSGSGKNSPNNYTTGIGFYTNMLTSTDIDLLTWSLYPYVQYWGYMFYVLVLFAIGTTIYFKTQNVTQPLIVCLALLMFAAGFTSIVPDAYKQYVIMILAALIAAIYYRNFTRD